MRTLLLLSASLTLSIGASAAAQDSYTRVVEPVPGVAADVINAPIEYDENGVVKAQYFKAEDLTPEQYQALLDEADRVRTYQDYTTTVSGDISDTYIGEGDLAANFGESQSVEIELFAPQSRPYQTAPIETVSATRTHVVVKGDTLYNISKRFDTTVTELKTANGLSSNALALGQVLSIPGQVTTVTSGQNTYVAQPIFASAPIQEGYVTRRVVEPVQPVLATRSTSAGSVYAVLPKDTLYSISRRACVSVSDLISQNNIAQPNALTPGQRLTLPSGHCLTN